MLASQVSPLLPGDTDLKGQVRHEDTEGGQSHALDHLLFQARALHGEQGAKPLKSPRVVTGGPSKVKAVSVRHREEVVILEPFRGQRVPLLGKTRQAGPPLALKRRRSNGVDWHRQLQRPWFATP